jgi:hypothetical protein
MARSQGVSRCGIQPAGRSFPTGGRQPASTALRLVVDEVRMDQLVGGAEVSLLEQSSSTLGGIRLFSAEDISATYA